MKIKFETNRAKIRNIDVFEKALHIIETETKQGFFRAKGESEFKFYNDKSIAKDGKLVELHIVKVYGKGEYKFNGNLSYNSATKEVKFYVLSVVEFDNFNYDDKKMAEFMNEETSHDATIAEYQEIIEKIEKNRPPYQPNNRNKNNNRKPYGKKKVDPRRQGLSDSQKEKRENKQNDKNYRTDSRRKVSNNKNSSF